jgi:hypothetical protein
MAEITQGQRDVPYEGANVLGAFAAGRQTAAGTGLKPEAESMLRLELLKALASISETEMELAQRSVTSYANIVVANSNSYASAVAGLSAAARVGLDNITRIQNGLELALDIKNSNAILSGTNIDEKTAKSMRDVFVQQDTALLTNENINSLAAILDEQKGDPRAAAQAIQDQITKSAALYLNANVSTIRQLQQSGASASQIVSTKMLAQDHVMSLAENGYQAALQAASQVDPKLASYLQDPSVAQRVRASVVKDTYAGEVHSQFVPSRQEQRAMKAEQDQAKENVKVFETKIQEMSVGLPSGVISGLQESLNINKELIDKGPEGFADSLMGMKAPLEVQMVKQSIQNQLRELDDPADPLTSAVYAYVTDIPYYENYMASLGFDDVFEFYKYSRNNMDETLDYEDLVSALVTDPETVDDVLKPDVIRNRLQVAGSSGEKGLFRNKNLTRKIERLVGFAVNRGPAWRQFSGTNTEEQLDEAIDALERVGDQEFTQQSEESSGVAADIAADAEALRGDDDFVDEGDPVEELDRLDEVDIPASQSAAERFAEKFRDKPRKLKRTLRAAERYREQLTGMPRETSRDLESKPYVLPGLAPEYVDAPVEEPVVEAAQPRPAVRPRVPSGVAATGRSTDVIRENLRKKADNIKTSEPTAEPEKPSSGIPPAGQRGSLYADAVKSFEAATGRTMTRTEKLALQDSLQKQ